MGNCFDLKINYFSVGCFEKLIDLGHYNESMSTEKRHYLYVTSARVVRFVLSLFDFLITLVFTKIFIF